MPSPSSHKSITTRWLRFLGILIAITAVWTLILPHWSETDAVQQRRVMLEQKGIDPAAFFYTDHERE